MSIIDRKDPLRDYRLLNGCCGLPESVKEEGG